MRIRKLQEKKLRKMLAYAYEHSDYYRKSFEQAGIGRENIADTPLSAFPVIDKKLLLQNFDELVTVSELKQEKLRRFDAEETGNRKLFQGKYHIVHSSGSTGKPGYFVYDENAWNDMLSGIIRAALWNMSMPQILRFLAKGPRIVYIAATDGRYGGAMAVGDGIDGVGASQLYLDIKMPLAEWVHQIREFAPNMIIGYPSAVKILGELVEEGGIEIDVFRVITCGEPLGASLRRYLEEAFRAEVINFYGVSESLALGVESSAAEGMVLFDDMNVIEMQEGSMYVTSLYNFAQPLIRYHLEDSFVLEQPKEGNSCPFTKAAGLLGRNEDILWFEDGSGKREFLHPLAVEGICVEGLRDYQFCQNCEDSFEMFAEISQTADEEEIRMKILAQMKRILEEKGLGFVQFYVRFVDEIRPDMQTGKKRLIINHCHARQDSLPSNRCHAQQDSLLSNRCHARQDSLSFKHSHALGNGLAGKRAERMEEVV